jgi:hypothetical protein
VLDKKLGQELNYYLVGAWRALIILFPWQNVISIFRMALLQKNDKIDW